MKDIKSLVRYLLVLVLFSTYGCVQMRDYTGAKDGNFVVGLKSGFDRGVDKKSYYIVGEDIALIIGDTKNDIVFKMGLPAKTKIELDGYENWMYEDKKIDLFFSGNRLRGWSCSRYEEAKVQKEK